MRNKGREVSRLKRKKSGAMFTQIGLHSQHLVVEASLDTSQDGLNVLFITRDG